MITSKSVFIHDIVVLIFKSNVKYYRGITLSKILFYWHFSLLSFLINRWNDTSNGLYSDEVCVVG